ncbi:MAG: hypothetical protein HN353_02820 [Bdellovibrionales bacterium]|jgi:hypothetical protein|nr:hypothetical protein [Bdellovibrionales bacterium]MBT3527162.1 hypothetical protein [Bdellovibrionales bacterium]MBT7765530.1 hypothetical protein [Bdellovibrionales bacterium]
MSEISVGKEVLSYCSKCKLTLAHLIVVMKDSMTIGKVKCNTCSATHAYKDPSAVKAKRKTTKKKTGSRASNEQKTVEEVWLNAMKQVSTESQKYTPKKKFSIGDKIDHGTFGPGVVDRAIDFNKVRIIFRHGSKVLMHNI